MRGKVAKKLRKMAFGDNAVRNTEYDKKITKKKFTFIDKNGIEHVRTGNKDTLVCKGDRWYYLHLKKDFKSLQRSERHTFGG